MADLSDPESSRAAFGEAGRELGKLDVLVNNAALQICKPIGGMELDEWDATMETNLRSIYLGLRHTSSFLKSPGGVIINVSSVHALATSSNISAYAASKGGVAALTRALAVELGGVGIRVNAVLPGAVDTDMLRDGLKRGHGGPKGAEKGLESLKSRTPLGRIGRPEDIAQAILFLSDNDRASFITGEAVVVDGGALARLGTE